MKYAFRFTTAARRQFKAIPQYDAMRILTALTRLGDDPRREDADIKKLAGHDELYRLRVGDYRLAYTIADGELVALAVKVGHRHDVYRALP
ncbi:type II toxin-antitoxin system RelE/ParE family toxin [Streptomyces sp. NPDC020412]|uniref:type II toxin-antitoxin system RelE/ParE family toxin n=1 Tax=Streptomyces sp. NPDC020412 TaxID=3365073 RepID=UPI0037B78EA9